MSQLKKTLEDFNTSLSELKTAERNGEEIEQNHFGDCLMIKEPTEWSKTENNYRVWLNHIENVRQGEPRWQIEAAGKFNGYRWATIAQGND